MSVKKYHTIYGNGWTIALLSIVAILLIAVFGGPALRRQMHTWKLLPEPERLTELYFTHPNSLPATYSAGQSQTVSFTVHNLQYKTVTYHYAIQQTSQSNGQQSVLATGSFTLQQNGYAQPSVAVVLGDKSNSKVSVQLTPANESIDYIVKGVAS